ncbi:MAG: GGDEF domain-containing protein, partial [Oscillatoriales cyanobacterium]
QVEEVVARLENQLTIQRQKNSLRKEIQKRREAEAILSQSKALLTSVLDTALDGIAALEAVRDPATGDISSFRCLVINPIIAEALQKKREDLIGKLIPKEKIYCLNPDLFERLIAVITTGNPLEEDFYYELGESCWFHFVAVKLADGFAVTVRDITARKKIELELQSANQKLELLANVDGLTQIANRRRFDHYLQQQWQGHLIKKEPLALILIDIDYFKLYNDYYGHQRGDFCLAQVAQALTQVMPQATGLVARYGGEEFAAILPNTDIHRASEVAERMIQSIASLMMEHEASQVSNHVTLSIGVSSLVPDLDNSLESLISQADQALYQAKENGRDRLMIAE